MFLFYFDIASPASTPLYLYAHQSSYDRRWIFLRVVCSAHEVRVKVRVRVRVTVRVGSWGGRTGVGALYEPHMPQIRFEQLCGFCLFLKQ